MFCNNCGNQLPDGAKFCGKCGAQITTIPNTKTVKNNKHSFFKLQNKVLLLVILVLIIGISIFMGSTIVSQKHIKELENYYSQYIGLWANEGIGWQMGGSTIEIDINNGTMNVVYQYTEAAPFSRVATVNVTFPISDISENAISVPFDNDGWDNAGTLILQFNESTIEYGIGDIRYIGETLAIWGIVEDYHYMVKNDSAYEALKYTQADYDALYAEETYTNGIITTSMILSDWGISEDEFRDQCELLSIGTSTVPCIDIEELLRYPADYSGRCFKFVNYYGNASYIDVSYKEISSDGYTMYESYPTVSWATYMLFFDHRDDIYSPTISIGDEISVYTIYQGVQTINGVDWLCFSLLSTDQR